MLLQPFRRARWIWFPVPGSLSKRTHGVVPVVLLPSLKANKRGVSGEVAENADTHTPTLIVYVAKIADVIRDIREGRAGRVTPVMVRVELGHVLALTIAHDGHILGLPHAASGIMKGGT